MMRISIPSIGLVAFLGLATAAGAVTLTITSDKPATCLGRRST